MRTARVLGLPHPDEAHGTADVIGEGAGERTGDLAYSDAAPVQLDLERIAGRRGGGLDCVPAGETEPERRSVIDEVGNDAE